jgi:hypothetical protein
MNTYYKNLKISRDVGQEYGREMFDIRKLKDDQVTAQANLS